jgi:hypothetical protein
MRKKHDLGYSRKEYDWSRMISRNARDLLKAVINLPTWWDRLLDNRHIKELGWWA